MTDTHDPTLLGRALHRLNDGDRVLVVTSPTLVYQLLCEVFADNEEAAAELKAGLIGVMDAVQANSRHGVLSGTIVSVADEALKSGIWPVRSLIHTHHPVVIDTETAISKALGLDSAEADHEERRGRPYMGDEGLRAALGSVLGIQPEDFKRDHPWYDRIGLSSDEQNTLCMSLGDFTLEERLSRMEDKELAFHVSQSPELQAAERENCNDPERVVPLFLQVMRDDICRKPGESYYLVFPDNTESRFFLNFCLHAFCTNAAKDSAIQRREYGRLM